MSRNLASAAVQEVRERDFERLVAQHRRELLAHCYRLLGSKHDAEDALQETLLGAWRAIGDLQSRSAARAWLYKIATNVCLRQIERRPKRILTPDYGPPFTQTTELGERAPVETWIEPWTEQDPAAEYIEREGIELAYVAALQHLPGTQRAVLILRSVLGYSAQEVAAMLDTTATAVNSALQRAREAVERRVPERTQQAEIAALGDDGLRTLVDEFVQAWEHADLDALVALLAEDAEFTMPPLPAWFKGRESVAAFLRDRIFETPWRLVPVEVNAQPGFACYIRQDGNDFVLSAVNVLSIRGGLITRINGFLDPATWTDEFERALVSE